jgi:hypothetical protein
LLGDAERSLECLLHGGIGITPPRDEHLAEQDPQLEFRFGDADGRASHCFESPPDLGLRLLQCRGCECPAAGLREERRGGGRLAAQHVVLGENFRLSHIQGRPEHGEHGGSSRVQCSPV